MSRCRRGPGRLGAATVLARAGARVRIVDRARFRATSCAATRSIPARSRCCGGSTSAAAIDARGLPVDGMRVTGARGVVIEGAIRTASAGARCCAATRLDAAAGCARGRRAVRAGRAPCAARSSTDDRVQRAWVSGRRFDGELRARVTIAADGRRSTLAFGLGLARHPSASAAMGDRRLHGEHRRGDDRPATSARCTCARPLHRHRARAGRPDERVSREAVAARRRATRATRSGARARELARDPLLRDRFAGARLAGAPVVLGPLAVDVDDDGASTGCCWPATPPGSSIR